MIFPISTPLFAALVLKATSTIAAPLNSIPDTTSLGHVRNSPPAAQEVNDEMQMHELYEKREPQPDPAQAIVIVEQEEILRPGVILSDGIFACTCSRSVYMTIVTSQAKNVTPSAATNSTIQAPTNSTTSVSETGETPSPSTDRIATEKPSPTGTESDDTSPADETPSLPSDDESDNSPLS